MNLEDVIEPEYGLQQDEWSLSKPSFGDEGQLEVVGWSGKGRAGKGNKLYILKCVRCNQDSSLFGDGYFRSYKDNIINGSLPCGCSRITKWSKDQYFVLCSRKAQELSYKFLGFVGYWLGKNTKIKMLCEKHGEWSSGTINRLINNGGGCPGCKAEVSTKPDDVMIASFFASGAFHPDTKFWRSERKDIRGYTPHWYVSCPECGETGEAMSGSLQKGRRSCACSKHHQQECYINWLFDEHSNAVAIKFGIARNSSKRIKEQDLKSTYHLIQYSVYSFPSVQACKKAERECLQELECRIVLKRDFPDGYTETTWPYNLERIIEIYQRNGGILK